MIQLRLNSYKDKDKQPLLCVFHDIMVYFDEVYCCNNCDVCNYKKPCEDFDAAYTYIKDIVGEI